MDYVEDVQLFMGTETMPQAYQEFMRGRGDEANKSESMGMENQDRPVEKKIGWREKLRGFATHLIDRAQSFGGSVKERISGMKEKFSNYMNDVPDAIKDLKIDQAASASTAEILDQVAVDSQTLEANTSAQTEEVKTSLLERAGSRIGNFFRKEVASRKLNQEMGQVDKKMEAPTAVISQLRERIQAKVNQLEQFSSQDTPAERKGMNLPFAVLDKYLEAPDAATCNQVLENADLKPFDKNTIREVGTLTVQVEQLMGRKFELAGLKRELALDLSRLKND